MVEKQSYFKQVELGANIDIEHRVYNLIYLVEIFNELYPEEFSEKRNNRGRNVKFDSKTLLTFILWGKANDIHSFRKLSQWCDNNDETCQLILDLKKPGKTTLNNFINNHTDLINKFDQFLIDLGLFIGLIDGKILYADGTVLKAWCNTFKKMYPYEIEYLKEFLTINSNNNDLLAKLQKYYIYEDDSEDLKEELQEQLDEFKYNLSSNGIYMLKLSLKSNSDFNKVLERIEHMEENISGTNSISIVDPESRHIKNKKGNMGLNYNYQTVTDNKYGFRVAHYITNNPKDQGELKRIVELISNHIHSNNYTICVDYGYWDVDILKEVSKNNTRVVIPDKADSTRKKENFKKRILSGKKQEIKNKNKKESKKLKKHQFKYDGKTDSFECPRTKKIFKVKSIVKIMGVDKKKYICDFCLKCENRTECCSQYRRVIYEDYDKYIEEIRRFYYSKEGQEIYKQRAHFAESSFAILLESRNFRGIKTRGIERINNELTLFEIHHNVKKFEKHTTNKFLKLFLNFIKNNKDNDENEDFFSGNNFKIKFIKNNDVITRFEDK